MSLASCSTASSKISTSPSPTLEAAIRAQAIVLNTAEPGGTDDDLLLFKQIVGDASIVGLGEATHGTHEFFTMKARLIEYLVGKHGFTTIAMENGWDASRPMDDYLTTGQGDLHALLRQDFYSAWQTQEVRGLLAWVRAYNADPSHTSKVHFAGIDSWNVTQAAFDDVVGYLRIVNAPQASQAQVRIRPSSSAPAAGHQAAISAKRAAGR